MCAHDRIADDEPFREPHTSQRTKLRIAALDELQEEGRRQTRGHGTAFPGRELRRVARQRVTLPLIVLRDVDDEGGRHRVVDEVVTDPVRLPGLATRVVSAQARIEDSLGEHAVRGDVIGMAIGTVRQRDGSGPRVPNHADHGANRIGVLTDRAIGPTQVQSPGRTEDGARSLRFGESLFHSPVAPHLAGREIAEPYAVSKGHVPGNRSAQPDLDVIGMGSEHEEVHGIHTVAIDSTSPIYTNMLDTLVRDARYALRMMRRTRASTTAAVLTLAVAIGVNTAVFSIVDAVLLRPLPYPDPDRLALVTRSQAGSTASDIAHNGRTWEQLRDHATTVDRAVFSAWPSGVNMLAEQDDVPTARHVIQQRVGAGFFRVLGIRPLIGREFEPAEDRAGGPPVTVLSAALWRSMLRGDPNVVGQTVTLRGEPFTIVGIMPDDFRTAHRADLWTPLRASRAGEGGGENYTIVARLGNGVSWARAIAEMQGIGRDLAAARPAGYPETTLSLESLQEGLTRDLRRPLILLWTAVIVVLLLASVNLAGLLLTRASARRREIATRMALGSSRADIMRQLVVESVVLAVVGGAIGVVFGYAALHGLTVLAEDAFVIWQPVRLDARAIAAAVVLSLTASVLFGVGPALLASRLDVQAGLTESGARSVAGARRRWPQKALVIAQVSMGIVLLVAAGLLLRTFAYLRNLDPGLDVDRIVTASVSLQDARYGSPERVVQLFEAALREIALVPGVEGAAVSLGMPYQRVLNLSFQHLERDRTRGITNAAYVAGDLFGTAGIPLRAGRSFEARDTASSPGVAIVNEAFVRTYFDSRDAIGRRIAFAGRDREIVGVVGNVQVRPGWGNNGPLAAMPLAYIPITQTSEGMLRLVHGWFSPVFVVRASGSFEQVTGGLRRAMDAVDPLLPFASLQRMTTVRAESLARPRFLMALLLGLAGAAILLAAVGIHGLVAASVAERTREMGIRLALGATAAQAVRTLALPGIVLTAVGVAIGFAGATAAGNLLRHFIWGVSATDPLTFVGVAALFFGVAAVASLVPSMRLLRLDPATTLRRE
jgi:predicted permease